MRSKYGIEQLEAWDIMYYSEKLRQKKYAISQEELKPYFPEQRVVDGMFAIVNKIYGINMKLETLIIIFAASFI